MPPEVESLDRVIDCKGLREKNAAWLRGLSNIDVVPLANLQARKKEFKARMSFRIEKAKIEAALRASETRAHAANWRGKSATILVPNLEHLFRLKAGIERGGIISIAGDHSDDCGLVLVSGEANAVDFDSGSRRTTVTLNDVKRAELVAKLAELASELPSGLCFFDLEVPAFGVTVSLGGPRF